MDPRKEAICNALAAFIRQRPGLEFANYGDAASYRAEQRSIARDKRDAETLLQAVRWRDGITADDILKAAQSGRLTIMETEAYAESPRGDALYEAQRASGRVIERAPREKVRHVRISYVAGQYFPTEYRRAVARLMATVLWDHTRNHCMPKPQTYRVEWQDGSKSPFLSPEEVDAYIAKRMGTDRGHPYKVAHYDASGTCPAAAWLRRHFRKEFGSAMQKRWFD
jgi:hypothetical protein